jgi:hypothetical protein
MLQRFRRGDLIRFRSHYDEDLHYDIPFFDNKTREWSDISTKSGSYGIVLGEVSFEANTYKMCPVVSQTGIFGWCEVDYLEKT